VRTLTGGTVSFGTFGSAHHYLLGGLIQDFRRRHPDVRVRVMGQNSAEVADAVRDGVLEAGLIALPVDDGGLEVRPSIREENHYVSASPQRAGVRLEPQIEVEYLTAALDLAARRLGDTIADPSVLVTRGFARKLTSVSLDPPLYDTYAFITRRNAHLSPATRAFMELAERRVAAMGSGS
jgi:DNA-binding transcriptional LysR family regulator